MYTGGTPDSDHGIPLNGNRSGAALPLSPLFRGQRQQPTQDLRSLGPERRKSWV